jgi:hypothetical protein
MMKAFQLGQTGMKVILGIITEILFCVFLLGLGYMLSFVF